VERGEGVGVVVGSVFGCGGVWGHDYWGCYDPVFEFSV